MGGREGRGGYFTPPGKGQGGLCEASGWVVMTEGFGVLVWLSSRREGTGENMEGVWSL